MRVGGGRYFVSGHGGLCEGALGFDPEELLVDPSSLQPLPVPFPVRGDPDAPRGVALHGEHDEAHREIVGLPRRLAEVEGLLGRRVPRREFGPLPSQKESLVALGLPPVEPDVVGRDLGVAALWGVILPCEDDLVSLAVIEDLEGLEADVLPLLLGEVALAVGVMRVSDGQVSFCWGTPLSQTGGFLRKSWSPRRNRSTPSLSPPCPV